MNSKNRGVLNNIFEDPIRSDVLWRDVEKLFVSLGAEISQGSGSRIRIALNGIRAVFHKPHPERVIDKGSLKSIRKFLESAGLNDNL